MSDDDTTLPVNHRASRDGGALAVGSEDGDVHMYEERRGGSFLAMKGHEGRINAITFSPSGSRLATAGFVDRTASL